MVLKDIADFVTDKVSVKQLNESNYIGIDNMLPNRGGIVCSEYLPEKGYATAFCKGDILIGNIRPYFKKIWLSTFDGGCSPDVLCLRSNGTVSPEFLYSCLAQDAFFDYDIKGAKGSKMPRGDKNHILKFQIVDIENKESVGKFINAITEKIEVNNTLSSKLESLARMVYDYWFLQFDFPDENGKPYKSSGGRMVWNEELKREIPEGWKVIDINTLCDIVDCLHSKKPSYKFENEKYYLLGPENITRNGYINLSNKYYISESDYKKWTSKIEAHENDFAITNAGRAGDIGKIPNGVICAIGRNITVMHPKRIDPYYFRQFLKSNYMKEQVMSNLDSGSFFMSFNVKSVKKLKILLPTEHVYQKSCEIFRYIVPQIEEMQMENQRLASLRDFLLPLLMNGQVTFKDAADMVQGA